MISTGSREGDILEKDLEELALHLSAGSSTLSPPSEELSHKPFYVSADSAPKGYAIKRSPWVAPLFLLFFAVFSAHIAKWLPEISSWYVGVLGSLTGIERGELFESGSSLSFRPFIVVLIFCLSFFAVGSRGQRLKLLVFALSTYGVSMVFLDLAMANTKTAWMPPTFSPVGGLFTGFTGLFVITFSIFRCYKLPSGIKVKTRVQKPWKYGFVLNICLVVAIGVVVAFTHLREYYFPGVHIRFIGGLDSEIVLFLLAIVCIFYLVSIRDRQRKPIQGDAKVPRARKFVPPTVAFLIPAHNEEEGIAECIKSIDAAAGQYRGMCRLYVVDNNSKDRTCEVATRVLAECQNLQGRLLECPTPGKSHALNFGLAHISEEIIVRIDADTLVAPSILPTMIPWFWDPTIGGVGGVPLPKSGTPRWIYPLRIIEVYYGVTFLRVAQGAVDGIMVMPGLIASYRRTILQELGGFGEGFNGEDADITMRIGRLGYRIITDPDVKVYTEVPRTLAHLREQRQRWARGLFHMAARNMSCIWMRQGIRGVLILPWSIANAARRSMMIPVLVCALVVELINPAVFSLREVSVLAGFIVGLQAIVIFLLLLFRRQFAIIPFIPAYLLFRVFRAYVAFETVLTLLLKPGRRAQRTHSQKRRNSSFKNPSYQRPSEEPEKVPCLTSGAA